MEKVTISIFIITGVYRVSSGPVWDHFYVRTKLDWFEAVSHCRMTNATMSSIWSQEEAQQLSQAGGKATEGPAWIGLKKISAFWKLANGELASYVNWERTGFCAQMKWDGMWEDRPCHWEQNFVCYSEDDKKYIFVHEAKTWTAARDHCKGTYTDLAAVRNPIENFAVMQTIKNPAMAPVWIGLFNDPWQWSNGEVSHFKHFLNNQPDNAMGDEMCVVEGITGWWDENCDEEHATICCTADSTLLTHERCHLQEKNMSWTSAQELCRQNNSDLPTVSSITESYSLSRLSLGEKHWIGMFHGRDDWQWSNQDDLEYVCWNSDLYCALMNTKYGYWKHRVCSELHPFACQTKLQSRYQYTLVQERKTWPEAQQHCRDQQSDLAMVTSPEENNALLTVAQGSATEFWIGLFNDPWVWLDGKTPTFFNWNVTEPKYPETYVNLCGAVENEVWSARPCAEPLPFFCSTYVREMVLVREQKTWEEAMEHCRAVHTDLTSLVTQKEMLVARSKASSAKTAYVWTGLRLLERHWIWISKETMLHQWWTAEGQMKCPAPNRCGALSIQSGLWEARPCREKLSFLCFRK